jgi:ABC-type arginine/histidine transport system permease subunit
MFIHSYLTLIASYLLIGVVIALLLELVIRWTDQKVEPLERVYLIIGWPFMVILFIYNFIKGMMGKD